MEGNNMGAHKEFIVSTGKNPYPWAGSGKIYDKSALKLDIYCFLHLGPYGTNKKASVIFACKKGGKLVCEDLNGGGAGYYWGKAFLAPSEIDKTITYNEWHGNPYVPGAPQSLGDGWSISPCDYYTVKTGADFWLTVKEVVYNGHSDNAETHQPFPTNWRLRIDGTKYPNYKLL